MHQSRSSNIVVLNLLSSSKCGSGGSFASDDPADGSAEGLADGAVDYEVDGAVENQEQVDEVDEDQEGGGEIETVLGEAKVVVVLCTLLRVKRLERERE